MATQERNVYAGLAVVIGGLMHARPRFFAKVMGELLFWVGEDKMLFGADYAIWEPKWQVEGLVDWDYPDETFSDFPRVHDRGARRRSSASTRRSSTASTCPQELQLANGDAGGAGGRAAGRRRRVTDRAHVLDALGTVFDPELDEPITSLRFVDLVRRDGRRGRRRPAAAADAAVRAELRVPDGGRRARRRAPAAGGAARSRVVLEDHYTGERDQRRRRAAARGSPGAFPGETEGELDALRELFHRKALVARQSRLCEELLAGGATPEEVTARRVGRPPTRARRASLPRAARAPGHPDATTTRRRSCRPDGAPIAAAELTHWLRMARLVRTSLEANGGICRSLLAVRYDIHDPEEVAAA